MNMNKESHQSMLKFKDIKNKLHKFKLNKLLNALKIFKAPWLKSKKVSTSYPIIAMLQLILKLIMIKTTKEEVIISVKINGSDMLINAMEI